MSQKSCVIVKKKERKKRTEKKRKKQKQKRTNINLQTPVQSKSACNPIEQRRTLEQLTCEFEPLGRNMMVSSDKILSPNRFVDLSDVRMLLGI